MIKYSIIVPCFNEEKNIPIMLNRFESIIKNRNDLEIILVNNGSNDGSQNLIEEQIPKYHFLRIVNVEKNIGYGNGILSGLRVGKGEYLGWTHADLQTDPGDILRAISLFESSVNPEKVFVKGYRTNRRKSSQFLSLGMGFLASLLFMGNFYEINAQPNLFHKSFFQCWENPPMDFSIEIYALVMAKKVNIEMKRLDVFFNERIYGESSWDTSFLRRIKVIKKAVFYMLKLRLQFFLQKLD